MNLILKSSFLTDQTGRVEILLDTSGIFSSLNPPPSAISPASGLSLAHTVLCVGKDPASGRAEKGLKCSFPRTVSRGNMVYVIAYMSLEVMSGGFYASTGNEASFSKDALQRIHRMDSSVS
jgi:hypothetical protein